MATSYSTLIFGTSVPRPAPPPGSGTTLVVEPAPIADLGYIVEGEPFVDSGSGSEVEGMTYEIEEAPFVPPPPTPPTGLEAFGVFLGPLADFVREAAPWVHLSDEGGQIVDFRAVEAFAFVPHTVRLRDAAGDFWPDTAPGCWGGVPGRGYEVWPGRDKRRIRFVFPALPLGVYDLLVYSPSLRAPVLEVPDAFRVVPRQRAWPVGYGYARTLPAPWPLGPRHPMLEDPATPENRPPYNAWQGIGKALGWTLQAFGAPPATRLREDYTPGDTWFAVETTLGFDAPRAVTSVWVDGLRVPVFGADPDTLRISLVAVDPADSGRESPPIVGLPAGTPVVFDVGALAHPDLFREPDLGEPAAPEFAGGHLVSTPDELSLWWTDGTPPAWASMLSWHRLDEIGADPVQIVATFIGALIGGGPGPFFVFADPAPEGYTLRLKVGAESTGGARVFALGAWTSVVVTLVAGEVRLYANAELQGSIAFPGSLTSNIAALGYGLIVVGGSPLVPRKALANVGVWDVSLSTGAIALLHAAGPGGDNLTPLPPVPSAPVGLWRAEPVAGTVANEGAGGAWPALVSPGVVWAEEGGS